MRAVVLLVLILSSIAGATPDGPPGSNAGDSGAALPGMGLSAEANLFTGAAGARFAFELPPGRNDLHPNLALVYGGSNEGGPFGAGWDIPIGRIERSTGWGVPTYSTAEDKFIVMLPDGVVELVSIGTNEYAARIDEAHIHVTLDPAANKWTMRDRGGRKYTFGDAAAARTGKNGGAGNPAVADTFAWHLTRIADHNDNTIVFTYAVGVGVSRVQTVRYTGRGATLGPYIVNFDWAPAASGRVSYQGGFRQEYLDQLEGVRVSYNSTRLRGWDLVWGASAGGGAPVLGEIQIQGRSATDVLRNSANAPASQRMTYHEMPIVSGELQAFATLPRNEDVKGEGFRDDDSCNNREFADLNGDGLADLVTVANWQSTGNWTVYLHQGRGASAYYGAGTPWPAPFNCISASHVADEQDTSSYTKSALVDLNGDGRVDYVRSNGATLNVYWNTGAAFSTTPQDTQLNSWVRETIRVPGELTDSGTIVDLVDINGDGLPDHVWNGQSHGTYDWGITSAWRVRLNQGGTFAPAISVPAPQRFIRYMTLLNDDDDLPITVEDLFDINGDGLADKIVAAAAGWRVWFGTGRSFSGQGGGTGWLWPAPATGYIRHSERYVDGGDVRHERTDYEVLDVTGDGLPDLVDALAFDKQTNLRWQVYVNTGAGFAATAVPTRAYAYVRSKRILDDENGTGALRLDTFDVNGDGYVDTIEVPGNLTTARVWLGHPAPHRVLSLATAISPIGGTTRFTYDLASAVVGVPFPIFVVSKVERFAPSHPASGDETTYSYQSPAFFAGHFATDRPREFRGFGVVRKTMAGRGSEQTIFFQDEVRKGKISWIQSTARPASQASPGFRTIVLTDWRCESTANCSAYDDPAGRFYPRLVSTARFDYGNANADPTGWTDSPAKISSSAFVHDACGNIIEDRATDDVTDMQVVTNSIFSPIAGGCDAQRRVCLGMCDRPAATWTVGSTELGAAETPVVIKGYEYDAVGNLLTSIVFADPDLLTTTLTYAANGNLETRTDPNGLVTTYAYDADGLYTASATQVVGGVTVVKQTTYDPAWFGKLTKQTDANGFVTEARYDTFHRPTKMFEYDGTNPSIGTSESEPSLEMAYTINGSGGQRVDEKPLVPIEAIHGGGVRRLVRSTFSDALMRVLQTQETTEVLGAERTVVNGATIYGVGGLVSAVHAPYVAPTTATPTTFVAVPASHPSTGHTYDPFGQVVESTPPDGARVRTTTPVARVVRTCDPMNATSVNGSIGSCVEKEADAFGRLVESRTFLGGSLYSTERNVYSGAGWLLATSNIANGLTVTTTHTYDVVGRRIRTIDPNSGEWRYDHDSVGNVVYVDDPEPNQHTETTYDALSRARFLYTYVGGDARGVGTRIEVARLTYDTSPRGKGRLAASTDHSLDRAGIELGTTTTVQEGYDARGNPLSVLHTIAMGSTSRTFRAASAYNAKTGRIEQTTYPYSSTGPETVEYVYSQTGRLVGLASAAGTWVRNIQHDEFNRLARVTYGNGVEDVLTYRDATGKGARDTAAKPGAGGTLEELTTQKPGSPAVRDVWYELYDVNKNVIAIHDLLPNLPGSLQRAPWVRNTVAVYDDADRLTAANQCSEGGYSGTYDTDAHARLEQKDALEYLYEDSAHPHRVSRVRNVATQAAESIAYDGNGGMTELPQGRRVEYDAFGRVVRVTRGDQLVARYAYDAAGTRVASWTPDQGTTLFFGGFDVRGGRVYRHISMGGGVVASHDVAESPAMWASAMPFFNERWFAGARATLVVVGIVGLPLLWPRRRRFGAVGRLRLGTVAAFALLFADAQVPHVLAQGCEPLPPPGGAQFYHLDHLGSPQVLTTSSGAVLEHLAHRPWGELAGAYDANGVKQLASKSPFLFSGKRGGDGSGLIYFGARYYDPELGMFLTHDPAAEFENPYMYVGNNPTNGVDPDGRCELICAAIIGFVVGFAAAAIQAAVNGATAGEALKAGAISGGIAAVAAGAGYAIVGAGGVIASVAAEGTTASVALTTSFYAASGAFATYGAVESFRNEQYVAGAFAVVGAAMAFSAAIGTLNSASGAVAKQATNLGDAGVQFEGGCGSGVCSPPEPVPLDEVVVTASELDGVDTPWVDPVDVLAGMLAGAMLGGGAGALVGGAGVLVFRSTAGRAGGIVASNGTRITGFTRHGINRAVGNGIDKAAGKGLSRAGVKPKAVLDALKDPLKIVEGIDNQGRPFQIFRGADARVLVNPQTGNIFSMNPLSGAGASR